VSNYKHSGFVKAWKFPTTENRPILYFKGRSTTIKVISSMQLVSIHKIIWVLLCHTPHCCYREVILNIRCPFLVLSRGSIYNGQVHGEKWLKIVSKVAFILSSIAAESSRCVCSYTQCLSSLQGPS
jgi:hypothetical protein